MPWTGSQFAERHNHSLHGGHADHAARIANATLRSGVPEGEAIAIANKWAQKHRAKGGGIYDPDKPQISREDDAEILSGGRPQGRDTDLNMTPPKDYGSPYGPIETRPQAPWDWNSKQIPMDVAPPFRRKGLHLDAGGGITTDPGGGIGGFAPNAQNQNPLVQGQIQRYAALPTEKLMELGARMGGSSQGQLIQRLVQQRHIMPQTDPTQAPQSPSVPGYAVGGGMGMPSGILTDPERLNTHEDGGFLHGTTGGQADAIKTMAPGGSYVLPAEVIAGLGEGNSLAGARIADKIFSTGPHGISLPHTGGGRGAPHPPAPFREQAALGGAIKLFPKEPSEWKFKSGGVPPGSTPVALSDGEYVVMPHQVIKFAGKRREGENRDAHIKRGHALLDKWVMQKHKQHIAKLQSYKGPVKE